MIIRKSQREIEAMARAGAAVAEVLELMAETIRPGVTTAELDRIAEARIRSRGGVPTFKGYGGAGGRAPFSGENVMQVLEPMFMLFDFKRFDRKVYEEIVHNFVAGRVS